MVLPAFKPASYEDLLDLPEHLVGEAIGGRLVTHPRLALGQTYAHSARGK